MSKKGSGGRPGDDILDELSSVSSLLGDAGRDVDAGDLDDSVPVLKPEPDDGDDGDAHTQIPLLGADDPAKPASARDLKKELAARDNPFLPRKQMDELARSRQQAGDALTSPPRATTATPTAAAGQPTDAHIRQAVDALLAEWMPKLEAELRERLTRLLKS